MRKCIGHLCTRDHTVGRRGRCLNRLLKASQLRTRMQQALDAAALAGVAESSSSLKISKATSHFQSQISNDWGTTPTASFSVDGAGKLIRNGAGCGQGVVRRNVWAEFDCGQSGHRRRHLGYDVEGLHTAGRSDPVAVPTGEFRRQPQRAQLRDSRSLDRKPSRDLQFGHHAQRQEDLHQGQQHYQERGRQSAGGDRLRCDLRSVFELHAGGVGRCLQL